MATRLSVQVELHKVSSHLISGYGYQVLSSTTLFSVATWYVQSFTPVNVSTVERGLDRNTHWHGEQVVISVDVELVGHLRQEISLEVNYLFNFFFSGGGGGGERGVILQPIGLVLTSGQSGSRWRMTRSRHKKVLFRRPMRDALLLRACNAIFLFNIASGSALLGQWWRITSRFDVALYFLILPSRAWECERFPLALSRCYLSSMLHLANILSRLRD